jgi:hypothetical protein
MESIQTFIEAIKIARQQTHANLTVFPLLAPDGGEPDYLTLEEALGQQNVRFMEKSEQGTFPNSGLSTPGKATR